MAIAIVLTLLVVGSVLFHLLSPWYFTPIASNWGAIDDTISITFWVTGAVFIIVNLFLAYAGVEERTEVPDPYYGNAAGFEVVLKLCEQGVDGVLRRVVQMA